VKKTRFVLALIALTLLVTTMMPQMAMAKNPTTIVSNDDNSAQNTTSVARAGAVSGGPIAVHPFINAKAIQESKLEIFVSDYANDAIDIFNINGKQIGQLTGLSGPQGIVADGKSNLYVANTNTSQTYIYAPPYKKAPKVLNDPGQYPVDAAVLNNGKFVAVTNILSTSGGPGSVTSYTNGKPGPTISSSDFTRVYFCAFDGNGNLYVIGENSSGTVELGEIAHLTKGGKTLQTLTYNGTIGFPGGVQVTTGGKIAVLDQLAGTIYTFNPPKNGSLGSPIATTILDSVSDAVTFVFTTNSKDLWTLGAAASAEVYEFAYPAGGNPVKSVPVNVGEPIGVAIVPAEIPGK
jgi:hypothetical protein